jgi:hypothetical protein
MIQDLLVRSPLDKTFTKQLQPESLECVLKT